MLKGGINLTVFIKEDLEKQLQYTLSDEKFQEIQSLEFQSLDRIRTNPTGKKYNRLFVLGRAPSDIIGCRPVSKWWCICDCKDHNIVAIRINNLTSNNSKSCGCLNIEAATNRIIEIGHQCAADLTNCRFGKLLAIKPTSKRKNGSVVWQCQCDCGNAYFATSTELSRGGCSSCGCLTESKGSLKIKQLLTTANIPYVTEKTFTDCRFTDTNATARFDFWVNNSFLIEYDGEQHFKESNNNFFKGSFKKRQEHDLFKNNYAKEHNIPLKRIPYTALKTLTLEDIMGDKYLL